MAFVYVGKLDPQVSERDLENEFRVYGTVISVWVAKYPPGHAYVFMDHSEAQHAISALDGKHGWCVKLRENSKKSVGGSGGVDLHAGPRGLRPSRSGTSVSRHKMKIYHDLGTRSQRTKLFYNNLLKINDDVPTRLEMSVSRALYGLECTSDGGFKLLKDLFINSATQIVVTENLNAIVIQYPCMFRKGFRKIHWKLVRELEKEFSGNVVVPVPIRKEVPQQHRTFALDAIVRDVVYPAKAVGKYGIFNCQDPMGDDRGIGKDDKRLDRIFTYYILDSKARNDMEGKLEAFADVVLFLSGKSVGFLYADKEPPVLS